MSDDSADEMQAMCEIIDMINEENATLKKQVKELKEGIKRIITIFKEDLDPSGTEFEMYREAKKLLSND